jgi:hypothetical protein
MNEIKKHWTNQELEVYIKYCKLNNLRYESIWVNMDDEEREKALLSIHHRMCQIDKPIKIYLDFEYVDTVRYSLIDFVKDENPNKLLTWIPDNFETKESLAKYLDHYIDKELQFN